MSYPCQSFLYTLEQTMQGMLIAKMSGQNSVCSISLLSVTLSRCNTGGREDLKWMQQMAQQIFESIICIGTYLTGLTVWEPILKTFRKARVKSFLDFEYKPSNLDLLKFPIKFRGTRQSSSPRYFYLCFQWLTISFKEFLLSNYQVILIKTLVNKMK